MSEIWIAVIVLGGIGIFVLLREFWCWYFKLNKIINLIEEIVKRLTETEKEKAVSSAPKSLKTEAPGPDNEPVGMKKLDI